jgi:lysophospholipase
MELIALARNPVPSGAIVGSFQGHDGSPMRYARWEPTRGPRRGTICCFTGRSEYIEKYFETIADLRRRGFAVAIMDWRGQGGSVRELANPRKGYIRDFSEYDRDLACFMREVVLPDCPPPYVALAHSMGAHILLRNAVVPASWFTRMVLTAPMIAFHESKVAPSHLAARSYAVVSSIVGFGASYVRGGSDDPDAADGITFETNELTSDRDRYARNRALQEAAKEIVIGSATVAWLRAAYASCSMLADPEYPLRVTVPLLIFIAGKDTIVSPRAIEDFATRLKLGRHVALPTARHEILQESDEVRALFWAAFDSYMAGMTTA